MSANNSGPAFPMIYWDEKGKQYMTGTGMTLRDYFAAKAMAELIRQWYSNDRLGIDASVAYKIADAMLAERAK